MAGVPVYSSRGKGGGWSLVGGARTDLTGFTSAEARALMVAANVGGSGAEPLTSDLTAALPLVARGTGQQVERLDLGAPSRGGNPQRSAEAILGQSGQGVANLWAPGV